MARPRANSAQDRTARDPRIVALYAAAREAGLTHDDVRDEILVLYGAGSSRDLDRNQYNEYMDHLRHLAAERAGTPLPPELHLVGPRISRRDQPERPGHVCSYAAVAAYLDQVLAGRPAWAAGLSITDLANLALALDDCRLYRTRDERLTHAQVDTILRWLAEYDAPVIARALEIWLKSHRHRDEAYLLGICRGVKRDRLRQQAQARRARQESQAAAQPHLTLI